LKVLKHLFLKGDEQMRKAFFTIVLTAAMSAVVSSQAIDGNSRHRESNELIALSREFVKTSIGAVAVEMGETKMTPSGPMNTAEVKRYLAAVGIKDAKVHIDGDSAVVKGQLVFAGQSPERPTPNNSSSFTIHFLKQKAEWKLVEGCFGECDER
jgi:hypothetical protein